MPHGNPTSEGRNQSKAEIRCSSKHAQNVCNFGLILINTGGPVSQTFWTTHIHPNLLAIKWVFCTAIINSSHTPVQSPSTTTTTLGPMESVEVVDRIYIGGLDPPRLTAQDVLSRLAVPASTSGTNITSPTTRSGAVTILSLECHPDKPYCHVTATIMTKTDTVGEIPTSAFQVLYKTFNNVKWKGCRLTVQPAQPHFLDRLRHEIQERDALRQQQQQQLEEDTTPPPPQDNRVPRRRLRIRRKFGEEAYHVDTKPWTVDDWNMFRMARDKLKRRVEKYQQSMKLVRKATPSTSTRGGVEVGTTSPSPVPHLLHRAVHIRFDKNRNEDEDKQDNAPSFHNNHSPPCHGANTSDDDEASSSSRSEPYVGHEHANVDALVQTEYAWSDEEDDNDSVDHDDSGQLVPNILLDNRDTMKANVGQQRHKESPLHEEFVQEIMQQQQKQKVSAKTNKETKYKWSSDEESDDDVDDEEHRERNRPLRQVSQSDEFAAGLAEDDFMKPDSEDEEGVESITNSKHALVEESDLANDVLANLGIFSSMFSDDGETKSIMVEGTVDEEKDPQKRNQQLLTGFAQSGIMLRYDPNDATMHQFEIEEENQAEKNDNGPPERKAEEISLHRELEANSESVPAQEEAGHLYEEKKLENVFREARETWKGNTDIQETEVRNTGGAFSFGFDLEPIEPESSGMGTLDLATAMPVTEATADPAHEPPKDAAAASEVPDVHIKATAQERRIIGFRFPDDLLAKYQADFFDANEEDDKEAWAKERLALTLDWKRKRKHAQTRIQKRMKMR